MARVHSPNGRLDRCHNISTPIINRRMLPLADRSTVSLVTIFDAAPIADGRPIAMTDAGVTTVCNFGRMVHLVENAVDVARAVMGIDRPRVAILSANEKQIPSLASTQIGAELAARDWPNATVYGPLSLDLATAPDSVAIKGLPDTGAAAEVAGQADVPVEAVQARAGARLISQLPAGYLYMDAAGAWVSEPVAP